MENFGIMDLLINAISFREILEIGTKPTILVSLDDIFNTVVLNKEGLKTNVLSEILTNSADILYGEDTYVTLAKTRTTFGNIIRTITNNTATTYYASGYPTNILLEIPNEEIAINTIKYIAHILGISCAIYDILPNQYENFEPININYDFTKDRVPSEANKPFKFIEYDKINIGETIKRIKIKNKLYCFQNKENYWIECNNRNYKNMKKIFRFKWFKLLLPIAVFADSTNTNFIFNNIWTKTNEMIKFNVDLDTMIKTLKLHPLQICGTTNIAVFTDIICGNEDYLHNFRRIMANPIHQWTQRFENRKLKEDIWRNLKYQYNYNGYTDLEPFLRRPLYYLKLPDLIKWHYPYNLGQLNHLCNQMSELEIMQMENLNDTSQLEYLQKSELIDSYISLI